MLLGLAIVLLIVPSGLRLREITRHYAGTAARDHVQGTLSALIMRELERGEYGYDYFVSFEKDNSGGITALTTNTRHINALSNNLISAISNAAGAGYFDMTVPIGSMTGSMLLTGRGPKIPVRAIMLTAAGATFDGEFASAGINQTRHRITLTVLVDINVTLPWGSEQQTVMAELLVAETVIVGKVPENYVNLK